MNLRSHCARIDYRKSANVKIDYRKSGLTKKSLKILDLTVDLANPRSGSGAIKC